MKSSVTIVPSYPAPDFAELRALAEDIAPVADELQVDIVDGEFVAAASWPFVGGDDEPLQELVRLRELPSNISLELDCMVVAPELYLDTFMQLGVDRVIVHYGSTEAYEVCLQHRLDNDYPMGLAVLPTVDLAEVAPLIAAFDFVQVMGIREVGAQGQAFAPEALDIIAAIKTEWPDKEVAVDGAVNQETIRALVAAGATRLAPGSAIVRAVDRAGALTALQQLANS